MKRLLWKLLPKYQRELLLHPLSVVDRQVVNKTLSGTPKFPGVFDRLECI
ncbi:sulfotransferase, partial [Pseudomonas sp. CCC2.2]|nr:sulfotransferase [Pseudomonas sp. CCC2.2]